MQFELARLAEFAKTCPETDKIWTSNGNTKAHRGFRDIVDSIFVQTKTVRFIRSVYEMNEVFALDRKIFVTNLDTWVNQRDNCTNNIVGKFGENSLLFIFC
jgi:hypothetical protein